MRLDKPIGILLLLWPTLWALWIATPGFPELKNLVVFVTGVCMMRSAGCIINDYVDRKFDGYVKRTVYRSMLNDEITKKEILVIFGILVLFSFLLVLTLNIQVVILSSIALALTLIYPFMKRYTYWPQLVLGIIFSFSIPIVFTAVNTTISPSSWIIFIANVLWTIIYDTQYAMVDRDDDIKIGIKSTAILFGNKDKLTIGILQIIMVLLMTVFGCINNANIIFYCAIFITGLLFLQQQKLIFYRERKACFQAFMNNNYVGLVIFLGLLLNY